MVTLTSARKVLGACACCVLVACGNGRLVAFEPSDSGVEVRGFIDDFEDLDTRAQNGFGWWYIVNDQTGTQTFEVVDPSDRPGDKAAMHTVGSGFTSWGAEVGVNFDRPFDATRFSALEFVVKEGSSGANTAMTVRIVDSNHNFNSPSPLTSTWSKHHITFAGGVSIDGPSLRLDALQIIGVQFAFDNNSAAFELWLDDVQFVE